MLHNKDKINTAVIKKLTETMEPRKNGMLTKEIHNMTILRKTSFNPSVKFTKPERQKEIQSSAAK